MHDLLNHNNLLGDSYHLPHKVKLAHFINVPSKDRDFPPQKKILHKRVIK